MKFSKEFKTGLLVVCASLVLILGYSYLKGANLFKKVREFHVQYPNVEGLSTEASVTVNGLQVGRVTQINITPETQDIQVSFIIEKSDFQFSNTSKVLLYNASLIGGKALAILPDYTNDVIAKDGDRLPGKMEKGMMEVIADKVLPLGDDLGSALVSLDTLVGNLNKILDEESQQHLKNTFKNIDTTIETLHQATHSIHDLLATNTTKINSSLDNIEKASENFVRISDSLATLDAQKLVREIETTIEGLNHVVEGLENGEGSLGKLLNDDSLYQHLEAASVELEQLMRDIKLNPKRYVHFSIFGRKNKEYNSAE